MQLWNLIVVLTLSILIERLDLVHSQFLMIVVSSTHSSVRCQAACLEAREALEDARQREKAGSVQNLVPLCHIHMYVQVLMGAEDGRGWCKI